MPRGANKKKWLVLKSAVQNNPISKEEMEKIIGGEPDTMSKVDKLIKGYGELGHGFSDEESEMSEGIDKGDLTTEGRDHIKDSNFAIPESRKYPIQDLAHARNALARVAQNGTPEEKAKVKTAVHRKYPNIGKIGKSAEGYVATDKPMGTEPQPGQVSEGPQVDDKMAASLKAAVRILSPHKEKLPADLLLKVLDAAGLIDGKSDGGNDMAEKKGSSRMSPEPIKDEHKIEAMKVAKEAANCAYKSHLEKLGYQKYPTAEMEQKEAANTDPDEPGEDDEQEGLEHNPDTEMNGMTVQHKSIKKSMELLSKLPKDTRLPVTQIFKAHQELVQKNESLSKQVEQMARRELRREFVTKAASMKHLGIEESNLVETLINLSQKAPKEYAEIEKALLKGSETVQKSALFGEIGSNLPDNSSSTYERIEKAAEGWVQKSGEKMSKEAALEAYIQTSEGRRMYNDYINQHASGRRN